MNKNIIVATILVILALGGGLLIVNNQSSSKSPDEASMVKEKAVMENNKTSEQGSSNSKPSRYVEYSKSVLDQSVDKRRVLYFYANWCPTCKPADENFKAKSSKIPEDVVVIRVNYNDSDTDQEEKDLANKYRITYQHTYVQIDATGAEVTKWNGGQLEELLDRIK